MKSVEICTIIGMNDSIVEVKLKNEQDESNMEIY